MCVACGGPTGLTLAHLLGMRGVEVVLLEKLEATVTEPRAIAIDGESLRTLQGAKLLEGFADQVLMGITADYVNGEGQLLFELGDADNKPYGFPMVNSFDQPALDAYLAASLDRHESVEACFGHTLDRFEQDEQGVRIFCTNGKGKEVLIRADYLVGCDGGHSTIRAALGISMQGESNPQPWLVIDTIDPFMDVDVPCRFYCDPSRPGMTLKKRHHERRWEWMLMPGEAPEELLEDARIRAIIAPYTDAEHVNIYRKRVYNFHAIIADSWRDGRVFLAGDAAHMTPPFAGQGLNSGFRDVANLGWKLAAVVRGDAGAGILESYESERRDHALELIDTALNLGRQIQPIDPQQAVERDAFFASLRETPGALEQFTQEMSRSIEERYIKGGLVVSPGLDELPGRFLTQPRVNSTTEKNFLLDEALGADFAIIGYNCDPAEVLNEDAMSFWRGLGVSLLAVSSRGEAAHDHWLEDAYGELGHWTGDSKQCLLLIRPDRFCMAAFTPENADEQLAAARQLLQVAKVTASA